MIKKYPNRRLYDTEESRYITLADVTAMITQGRPPQIISKATREDITPEIYATIIVDMARTGAIPSHALLTMIRGALAPNGFKRPAAAAP